jgi:Fe-S-cluster containining protein
MDAFNAQIEPVLEKSIPRLEAAATGTTPYEIIHNLAKASVEVGIEIYEMALSHYGTEKKGIACFDGCSHCCHLNSTVQTRNKANAVGMTLWDGVMLLEHLVQIRHTETALKIFENMQQVWEQTPKTLARFLCPFEVNNTCGVYPARPMVCRLYFSNNATHCAVQADIPANERQFDTPVAKTMRPIRRKLVSNAETVMTAILPDSVFGYFDFLKTSYTIVMAVMDGQEAQLRTAINTHQSF